MAWGPIIRHDGKGCPLPDGTLVMAVFERDPDEFSDWMEGRVGSSGRYSWDWSMWRSIAPDGFRVSRIVRYRVWTDDTVSGRKQAEETA